MRSIYLSKKGTGEEAFDIKEVEKPKPNASEVQIEVECFGLNFADVMSRRGLYGDAPKMPFVPGYEVVGKIREVGEGVGKDWLGKRVVAFTRFGGYSEYVTTPLMACAEIGDMVAGEAASIAVQYATAYYMAKDAINLHQGDIVMIHAGAGGVGTALIQLCKMQGCTVIANAGSDEKLQYMLDQGADHVINYRKEDYLDVIPTLTKGVRLAATFNPIGGKTYKKDMKLIGAGGKVILFGGSERIGKKWKGLATFNFIRKMGLMMPIGLVMISKSVMGVNMLKIGDERPEILRRCMENVITLVTNGKLKPYVGGRFKFDEIGKAHDLLESRKSIGKLVVFIDKVD